jgi:hypothetical protein
MMHDLEGWLGIARVVDAETRSVSAENPTGERAGGAAAAPGDDRHCTEAARRLGRGWKVRPCLRDIAPGETVLLADLEGPGVVQHLWCTVDPSQLRTLALRVLYDDQPHASIESPLGDFFANGIDGLARVVSLPIAVNPRCGMNCYWPLPFRDRLRLSVTNDGPEPVKELFYQLTYARQELPGRALRGDGAHLDAAVQRLVGRGRGQVLHRR